MADDEEAKPLVWPGVTPLWEKVSAGAGSSSPQPSRFSFDWARSRTASRDGSQKLLILGERGWGGLGEGLGHISQKRWRPFFGLLACSGCFFLLAVAFFPLVLLRPHKFCIFFCMGSLLSMASFAVLRGPYEQLKHMFSMQRLPFTSAYLGSMALTLYAALIVKSYLLVMLCAVVQAGSLAHYLLSYIPGGAPLFKLAARGIVRAGSACCCRRRKAAAWSSSSSLPL